MVRQPQSLAEAKQIVREEKSKVVGSISRIAGSRWLLAILATFALAFGTHLAYAPTRLPPVTGLSVAHLGFPTDLDFGVIGEQAVKAREAAQREDQSGRAVAYANADPERVRTINAVGFGGALVLLFGNVWIMTKRRRFSRG